MSLSLEVEQSLQVVGQYMETKLFSEQKSKKETQSSFKIHSSKRVKKEQLP
jgi:hypothetical protein